MPRGEMGEGKETESGEAKKKPYLKIFVAFTFVMMPRVALGTWAVC